MPGHLAPGHRAGGRYRLESELGRGTACSVWRATDETLERQVALRFFDQSLDRSTLVERAGVAASLTHPRVVRIFDTGFDGGQFFTVCELLPGSLAWARLPISAEDAIRNGLHIAEALSYAHQRGIAHGALHPGNVLLGEQGAKVADFAMSAESLAAAASQQHDLVQLGDLLYLMLTGRGKDPSAPGGRPLPDEPKGLARVVLGLRDGAYAEVRPVQADLAALLPHQAAPSRSRAVPLVAGIAALLVVVAALGAARFGRRERPSPKPSLPAPITGKPLRIVSAQDFDPLGTDGREGHNTVRRIFDGSTSTFWSTERYRGGPKFSGRKAGVGVILTLDSIRRVGRARVLLIAPGCSFQLRYASEPEPSIDNWNVAASQARAPATTVLSFRAEQARYWLLWITNLTKGVPGAGRAYACGVADVGLYPP
jgi:serine/threonine protein kinase